MLQVKNWQKFQHFRDRRPPWIKLYRDLLDDPEYHALPPESAKCLTLLWLMASEDKTGQGYLPDINKISFLLRLDIKKTTRLLNSLSHYILLTDDITAVSERCQHDNPEERREEERREEICRSLFESAWSKYGNYGNKKRASTYWLGLTEEERSSVVERIPVYLSHLNRTGFKKKMFDGWINPEKRIWETTYENSEATDKAAKQSLEHIMFEGTCKICGQREQSKQHPDTTPIRIQCQRCWKAGDMTQITLKNPQR